MAITLRCTLVVALVIAASGNAFRPAGAGESRPTRRERRVTIAEVPGPARQVILKHAGAHPLREIEEETLGSRKVYEAEWLVKGVEHEVRVSADGKLLSLVTERNVALSQVPQAVRKTLLKAAGAHAIREIEELTTREGHKIYEAEWIADGREVEVRVTAAGKLIGTEHEDLDD